MSYCNFSLNGKELLCLGDYMHSRIYIVDLLQVGSVRTVSLPTISDSSRLAVSGDELFIFYSDLNCAFVLFQRFLRVDISSEKYLLQTLALEKSQPPVPLALRDFCLTSSPNGTVYLLDCSSCVQKLWTLDIVEGKWTFLGVIEAGPPGKVLSISVTNSGLLAVICSNYVCVVCLKSPTLKWLCHVHLHYRNVD